MQSTTRDTIPYFFPSSGKKKTYILTGIFVYKLCGIKSCDVVLPRENLKRLHVFQDDKLLETTRIKIDADFKQTKQIGKRQEESKRYDVRCMKCKVFQ